MPVSRLQPRRDEVAFSLGSVAVFPFHLHQGLPRLAQRQLRHAEREVFAVSVLGRRPSQLAYRSLRGLRSSARSPHRRCGHDLQQIGA